MWNLRRTSTHRRTCWATDRAWLMQMVATPLQWRADLPDQRIRLHLRTSTMRCSWLCMTPLVVMIAELFQPAASATRKLASLRALDSFLGGLLGLLPASCYGRLEGAQLRGRRRRRCERIAITCCGAGGKPTKTGHRRGAAPGRLTSNNAEASLQRVLSRPGCSTAPCRPTLICWPVCAAWRAPS